MDYTFRKLYSRNTVNVKLNLYGGDGVAEEYVDGGDFSSGDAFLNVEWLG